MYYLKYRPQTIAEIDHAERRKLLESIFVSAKDIPHAFLLVGPKGTGKTSTARIIAKVLNCESNVFAGKGKMAEACGTCSSCVDIQKGRFLDLIELDAASNRGIDDVRALREQIGYSPARGRYKVYIIDEVHMLTKEAFNALLKTLEEPPNYVVFVLATTEREKLPETIASRCIPINFNKATTEELVASLSRIVKGEKLKIDEKVLAQIAEKANGSFRDGAKLLELAVQSTDLSHGAVQKSLNENTDSNPVELVQTLLAKDEEKAVRWLHEYAEKGGSAMWLTEQLLSLLHDVLLAKKGLVVNKEKKLLDATYQPSYITKLMKLILDSYPQTKYSPIDILPLMIATVEFCATK